MERRDWTLLAISFNEGQPMSPVQLQKTLFLLGRECPKEVGSDFYSFTPYNYGPFDAAIYRDASSLAEQGLIHVERATWRSWSEYAITPDGMVRATLVAAEAPPRATEFLKAAVDWARPLSFQALVSSIYRRYPEQRANSVFQD